MWKNILLGTSAAAAIFLLMLVAGIAAAFLSPGSAHQISLWLKVAGWLAPFGGGFVAGWTVRARGWAQGGWIGVLFTLVFCLAGELLFPGGSYLNLGSLGLNFCLGCVGGVCGVNVGLYAQRQKRLRGQVET